MADKHRAFVAEGIATAFLLATIVGSGIMGERLAAGNALLTLLVNSIATGAVLIVLILTFGSISSAHMNPLVTLTAALHGEQRWRDVPLYILAQIGGGVVGVMAAHVMFQVPLFQPSIAVRTGPAQWLSEVVATFGLLTVIRTVARKNPDGAPFAIGLYVVAAYWFTGSTAFANPAVTFARAFTNTFSGIRFVDVPAFVVAQFFGAALAYAFVRWLVRVETSS